MSIQRSYPRLPSASQDVAAAVRLAFDYIYQLRDQPSPSGFVDRGDPPAWDKDTADWIADGLYYDWDLNPIVPNGAQGVLLRVSIRAAAAALEVAFRKPRYVVGFNLSKAIAIVANMTFEYTVVVGVDSGRTIQYAVDAGAWTDIQAVVRGWWM